MKRTFTPAQTVQSTPAPISEPYEPPYEQDTQPQTTTRRASRRKSLGLYEAIVYRLALIVALILSLGIWISGAWFTVQWLWSIGVPLDGIAPAAWIVPIGITAVEIGVFVGRSKVAWLWFFWIAVLGVDVFTTAAGLVAVMQGRVVFGHLFHAADITSWAVTAIGGLLMAIAPEPAARAIWRELWS